MTRTKLMIILLVLLATLPAFGDADIQAPLPGEALYLIVLGERPSEPDLAALGGRVLQSWSDRRLVAIQPDRAGELKTLKGVTYIQRIWTGEPFASIPADPKRTLQSQGTTLRTNAAAPAWTTGVYLYDPSGNIKAMGADTYRYDSVGRVTHATVQNQSQSYTFDPYGNLLQLGERAHSIQQATNRLIGHVYDDMGNMTKDPNGRSYQFDALGMVTAIDLAPTDSVLSDVRMIYTADDERIVIAEGATTRYRLRDLTPRLLREWTSTGGGILEWERDYVYAGGDLVAGEVQVDQDQNGVRHYHKDHLGSIRMVTDGAGELVARHDYLPFGEELPPTTTEFDNTSKAPRDPAKFTGHERDYFSGANLEGDYVDYMHARYYAPKWGRFLSVDPVLDIEKALVQPQRWNRYSYVMNQPLGSFDPDGQQTRPAVIRPVNLFDRLNNPLQLREYVVAEFSVGQKVFSAGGTDLMLQYRTSLTDINDASVKASVPGIVRTWVTPNDGSGVALGTGKLFSAGSEEPVNPKGEGIVVKNNGFQVTSEKTTLTIGTKVMSITIGFAHKIFPEFSAALDEYLKVKKKGVTVFPPGAININRTAE